MFQDLVEEVIISLHIRLTQNREMQAILNEDDSIFSKFIRLFSVKKYTNSEMIDIMEVFNKFVDDIYCMVGHKSELDEKVSAGNKKLSHKDKGDGTFTRNICKHNNSHGNKQAIQSNSNICMPSLSNGMNNLSLDSDQMSINTVDKLLEPIIGQLISLKFSPSEKNTDIAILTYFELINKLNIVSSQEVLNRYIYMLSNKIVNRSTRHAIYGHLRNYISSDKILSIISKRVYLSFLNYERFIVDYIDYFDDAQAIEACFYVPKLSSFIMHKLKSKYLFEVFPKRDASLPFLFYNFDVEDVCDSMALKFYESVNDLSGAIESDLRMASDVCDVCVDRKEQSLNASKDYDEDESKGANNLNKGIGGLKEHAVVVDTGTAMINPENEDTRTNFRERYAGKAKLMDSVSEFNNTKDVHKLIIDMGCTLKALLWLRYSFLTDLRIYGEVLCKQKNADLLEMFTSTFNFFNMTILEALRVYLVALYLPGESQIIHRVIHIFSNKYATDNNEPLAYVFNIAISLIVLNTKFHNSSIKVKPTFEVYLSSFSNNEIKDSELMKMQFMSVKTNKLEFPTINKPGSEHYMVYKKLMKLMHEGRCTEVGCSCNLNDLNKNAPRHRVSDISKCSVENDIHSSERSSIELSCNSTLVTVVKPGVDSKQVHKNLSQEASGNYRGRRGSVSDLNNEQSSSCSEMDAISSESTNTMGAIKPQNESEIEVEGIAKRYNMHTDADSSASSQRTKFKCPCTALSRSSIISSHLQYKNYHFCVDCIIYVHKSLIQQAPGKLYELEIFKVYDLCLMLRHEIPFFRYLKTKINDSTLFLEGFIVFLKLHEVLNEADDSVNLKQLYTDLMHVLPKIEKSKSNVFLDLLKTFRDTPSFKVSVLPQYKEVFTSLIHAPVDPNIICDCLTDHPFLQNVAMQMLKNRISHLSHIRNLSTDRAYLLLENSASSRNFYTLVEYLEEPLRLKLLKSVLDKNSDAVCKAMLDAFKAINVFNLDGFLCLLHLQKDFDLFDFVVTIESVECRAKVDGNYKGFVEHMDSNNEPIKEISFDEITKQHPVLNTPAKNSVEPGNTETIDEQDLQIKHGPRNIVSNTDLGNNMVDAEYKSVRNNDIFMGKNANLELDDYPDSLAKLKTQKSNEKRDHATDSGNHEKPINVSETFELIRCYSIKEKYSDILANPTYVLHFFASSKSILNQNKAKLICKEVCPLKSHIFSESQMDPRLIYMIKKADATDSSELVNYTLWIINLLSCSLPILCKFFTRNFGILLNLKIELVNAIIKIFSSRVCKSLNGTKICCACNYESLRDVELLIQLMIKYDLCSKTDFDFYYCVKEMMVESQRITINGDVLLKYIESNDNVNEL